MSRERAGKAEAFGAYVAELRKKAGLTQEELAERLDCDSTYVSHIERGRRFSALSPEWVTRMTEALGLDEFEKEEFFVAAGLWPPLREPSEDVPTILTADRIRSMELKSLATASAPTCAFLWGDWSVLETKKAILVPVPVRVKVLVSASERLSVRIYRPLKAAYVYDDWHSKKLQPVYTKAFKYLAGQRRLGVAANPFLIHLICDAPFGIGIHETAAASAGLGCCLATLQGSRPPTLSSAEIAGIIESFYYPVMSWATIACVTECPQEKAVLLFNRQSDGGIDFREVGRGNVKEIERNRHLTLSKIERRWIPFDTSKLTAFYHQTVPTDLDETYRILVRQLRKLGFLGTFAKEFEEAVQSVDYECVGRLMRFHQTVLAHYGFSSHEFEKLIDRLMGLPGIVGIKSFCTRYMYGGALIALFSSEPQQIEDLLMGKGIGGLHSIVPFLEPTASASLHSYS